MILEWLMKGTSRANESGRGVTRLLPVGGRHGFVGPISAGCGLIAVIGVDSPNMNIFGLAAGRLLLQGFTVLLSRP